MDEELFTAVQQNNLNRVRELIENGANIEARSRNSYTPLMNAISYSGPEMVRLLIDLGANIEARSAVNYTPLLIAVSQNKPEIARLLIDLGANIDARTNDDLDFTPLSYAALHDNIIMVRLLIELGANIDARDNKGRTIFDKLIMVNKLLMIDVITNAETKKLNVKIRPHIILGEDELYIIFSITEIKDDIEYTVKFYIGNGLFKMRLSLKDYEGKRISDILKNKVLQDIKNKIKAHTLSKFIRTYFYSTNIEELDKFIEINNTLGFDLKKEGNSVKYSDKNITMLQIIVLNIIDTFDSNTDTDSTIKDLKGLKDGKKQRRSTKKRRS
jgi:hypothetical protein